MRPPKRGDCGGGLCDRSAFVPLGGTTAVASASVRQKTGRAALTKPIQDMFLRYLGPPSVRNVLMYSAVGQASVACSD